MSASCMVCGMTRQSGNRSNGRLMRNLLTYICCIATQAILPSMFDVISSKITTTQSIYVLMCPNAYKCYEIHVYCVRPESVSCMFLCCGLFFANSFTHALGAWKTVVCAVNFLLALLVAHSCICKRFMFLELWLLIHRSSSSRHYCWFLLLLFFFVYHCCALKWIRRRNANKRELVGFANSSSGTALVDWKWILSFSVLCVFKNNGLVCDEKQEEKILQETNPRRWHNPKEENKSSSAGQ